MWGAISAAATDTLAGAMTARANKKERDKIRKEIDKRERDNNMWFNRRYNEDALAKADAQRSMTQLRKMLQDSNKAVAGQQSVVGGTDEATAAQRERSNQAAADAMSQIAAAAADEKDKVDEDYRTAKENISNARVGLANQQIADRNAATTQLIKAVNNAANGIDSAMSDRLKAPSASTPTSTVSAQAEATAQKMAPEMKTRLDNMTTANTKAGMQAINDNYKSAFNPSATTTATPAVKAEDEDNYMSPLQPKDTWQNVNAWSNSGLKYNQDGSGWNPNTNSWGY